MKPQTWIMTMAMGEPHVIVHGVLAAPNSQQDGRVICHQVSV